MNKISNVIALEYSSKNVEFYCKSAPTCGRFSVRGSNNLQEHKRLTLPKQKG